MCAGVYIDVHTYIIVKGNSMCKRHKDKKGVHLWSHLFVNRTEVPVKDTFGSIIGEARVRL